MIKSKLAILIDTLICTVIILLLSYSWINKLIKNAFLSLFIANIISIILFICLYLHFIKKHRKIKTSLKESKLFNETIESLKYLPQNLQIDYFCKLTNSTFINEKFYINGKYHFYININTPLSANDFYTINNYNLSNNLNKELVIISLSADESFTELIKNSPVKYTVFLKEELFELIKVTNSFITSQNEKISVFDKIKKHCKNLSSIKLKNLFISGISLVLLSFFVPYNFLYLTIGSLLLILSMINLFNKNKQPFKQKEILVDDIIKK